MGKNLKRIDRQIDVCITESLGCIPETNITRFPIVVNQLYFDNFFKKVEILRDRNSSQESKDPQKTLLLHVSALPEDQSFLFNLSMEDSLS